MKLIIGNKNYSSWSLRAWLLLTVNELPFEEVRIALSTESTAAKIAKHTDAGTVPVLIDNGLIVWDSLAICEYISEQYLDGGGWPVNVQERATARSYCAEMHSSFFALRQAMPMNCRAINRHVHITDDLQEDISRIETIWTNLRKKHAVHGPWLFGKFTIADCMFAPVVFRFATYDVPVSETGQRYMANTLGNPHVLRWLEHAKKESETIEEEEIGL